MTCLSLGLQEGKGGRFGLLFGSNQRHGDRKGENTLKWTVCNSLLQQPEQQKQILFLIMFVQVNIKIGPYSWVLGQKQPGIQTLATNSSQAGWSTTIGMPSWEGKHLSGLNEWWGAAPFLPLSLYSNVLLSGYLALCFLPHFSCSIWRPFDNAPRSPLLPQIKGHFWTFDQLELAPPPLISVHITHTLSYSILKLVPISSHFGSMATPPCGLPPAAHSSLLGFHRHTRSIPTALPLRFNSTHYSLPWNVLRPGPVVPRAEWTWAFKI